MLTLRANLIVIHSENKFHYVSSVLPSVLYTVSSIWIFCPRAGGAFLMFLIDDCSHPTLWNLIKMFKNLSNPQPLPVYLHPHRTYIETVGAIKELFTYSDSF